MAVQYRSFETINKSIVALGMGGYTKTEEEFHDANFDIMDAFNW